MNENDTGYDVTGKDASPEALSLMAIDAYIGPLFSLYSTATQNHSRWVLLRHFTQKIVLLRHLMQRYQHVSIFCVR